MPWPLTFGSGKFDTPCERMHLANATAPASLLWAVTPLPLFVEPEEPQLAITSAQPRAAIAMGSLRRWRLAVLLWLAVRNIVGFRQARAIGQSRGYTAGAITPLSRRYAVVTRGAISRGGTAALVGDSVLTRVWPGGSLITPILPVAGVTADAGIVVAHSWDTPPLDGWIGISSG
jgi:hypothetical protein